MDHSWPDVTAPRDREDLLCRVCPFGGQTEKSGRATGKSALPSITDIVPSHVSKRIALHLLLPDSCLPQPIENVIDLPTKLRVG
jgi:hypothetical protein